mmetsp:Transcript_1286/g.2569  ORF Transcript_1286/g.2569 Transcript_1286/m.2569 type:complete len:211 (-) Transcript_1286:1686-2318(-)
MQPSRVNWLKVSAATSVLRMSVLIAEVNSTPCSSMERVAPSLMLCEGTTKVPVNPTCSFSSPTVVKVVLWGSPSTGLRIENDSKVSKPPSSSRVKFTIAVPFSPLSSSSSSSSTSPSSNVIEPGGLPLDEESSRIIALRPNIGSFTLEAVASITSRMLCGVPVEKSISSFSSPGTASYAGQSLKVVALIELFIISDNVDAKPRVIFVSPT